MSKEIQLTKGKVTLVDDEDYEMLIGLGVRWCVNDGYAFNSVYGRMHRFLSSAPKGRMVDHVNGNKLDNRRENLRIATNSQNQANRKVSRGVSKFKGVTWQKRTYDASRGYWKAQIVANGVVHYLGSYDTDLDAAKAYNDAAVKFFGEYAHLNDLSMPPSNLRSSSRRQVKRSSPSGYKGVSFDKSRGKWVAQLVFKGVTYLKTRFQTPIEAAKAYDIAAKHVFGQSAVTNF
jgi:hypothetical protein